jgi:hypothetical protein
MSRRSSALTHHTHRQQCTHADAADDCQDYPGDQRDGGLVPAGSLVMSLAMAASMTTPKGTLTKNTANQPKAAAGRIVALADLR